MIKKFLLIFCLGLSLFLASTRLVSALLIDGGAYPEPCATCTDRPGNCAKGRSASDCPICGTSENDCCGSGLEWHKYAPMCRVINIRECDWVWVHTEDICSIGDKCISGETGLRSGSCNCNYGGIYKYCCDENGNPEGCIPFPAYDDGRWPPEGQCPGGYGFDGVRVRNSPCTGSVPSGSPTPTGTLTPTPPGGYCPGQCCEECYADTEDPTEGDAWCANNYPSTPKCCQTCSSEHCYDEHRFLNVFLYIDENENGVWDNGQDSWIEPTTTRIGPISVSYVPGEGRPRRTTAYDERTLSHANVNDSFFYDIVGTSECEDCQGISGTSCGPNFSSCCLKVWAEFNWRYGPFFQKNIRIGGCGTRKFTTDVEINLPDGWRATNARLWNSSGGGWIDNYNSSIVPDVEFYTSGRGRYTGRLIQVGVTDTPLLHAPEAVLVDPINGHIADFTDRIARVTTVYHDADDDDGQCSNNLIIDGGFEAGDLAFAWSDPSWADSRVELVNTDRVFGANSLHMWTQDSDNYRVRKSQWLNNVTASTYTFSAFGKVTNPAVLAQVAVEEYSNGEWIAAHALVFDSSSWENQSIVFNRDGSTTHLAVSVFLGTGNTGEIADFYVDGIMLQEGSHANALPSDIDIAQLNMRIQGGSNDYATWPIRIMFANHWDNVVSSDARFYVQDKSLTPSSANNYGFQNGSGAVFDGASQSWYLASNLEIRATDDSLQGTLLSGVENTRIYFNGSSLVANWVIEFEPDYLPEGTYDEILYVADVTGREDETADRGVQITYNNFDFWDLGDFTFVPSRGTITGNIYISNTVTQPCETNSGYPGGGTIEVITSEGTESQTLGAGVDEFTFTDVLAGDITAVFTPAAGWQCNNLCSAGAYPCSRNFTLVSGETENIDFYTWQPSGDYWYQVVGGDIVSFGAIVDPISEVCAADYGAGGDCEPFINRDDILLGFDEEGITAATDDIDYGNGSAIGSPNNWQVYDTNMARPAGYGYDYYLANLGDAEVESANLLSAISELNGGNIPSGTRAIVLIDGDLTIDQDLSVDSGGLALVVVSGNITINGDVDNVEGVFIANGSITVNDGDNQADLQGTFVADADGNAVGSILLGRDLGTGNFSNPGTLFTFRPDFIVQMILHNIGLEPISEWEEVNP